MIIGTETDRGLWVAALVAAGYTVYGVNTLQASRYRERHGVSGAKSDTGDSHMLADMVRTDSHQLRAGPAYPSPPVNLRQPALAHADQTAPVTWRHGTKAAKGNPGAAMTSHFMAIHARPANRDIPRAAAVRGR